MKPYIDKHIDRTTRVRTFNHLVESDELVWHRDRKDRIVTVIEGKDWYFQMDNEVPKLMEQGSEIVIPKMEYHRIYKAGSTPLKLEIKEPMQTFKEHLIQEQKELEEIFGSVPFKIDTLAWSSANRGQTPKGKGDWKFSYKVPVKNPSISYIDDGEFSFKGKFKDAVKKLADYLKKSAPKGTMIKQAMVKLEK